MSQADSQLKYLCPACDHKMINVGDGNFDPCFQCLTENHNIYYWVNNEELWIDNTIYVTGTFEHCRKMYRLKIFS